MQLTVKTSLEEGKHLSVVLVGSHFCPTLEGPTRAPQLINQIRNLQVVQGRASSSGFGSESGRGRPWPLMRQLSRSRRRF